MMPCLTCLLVVGLTFIPYRTASSVDYNGENLSSSLYPASSLLTVVHAVINYVHNCVTST